MADNGNKTGTRAVKTVALMMGATVIAKLLGMLRSTLQANAYGVTATANAFTAASKLPLAFFDMFLAAAVMGCFIPVYNSFKEKDADRVTSPEADRFACIFLNFIMLLCGILAMAGILFAKPLIGLIGHGLDAETTALAVTLTRIMFPLVIFTGAAYTLVGVLQSKGSFIVPALISAVSNAGVVLYLAFLNAPLGESGIYGLAVAYLASWLIQLLTLIVPLHRQGFRYRFALDLKNPALIRALKMAPPIMIGSWLTPAGTLIGQYFASTVAQTTAISGATTVFDYANNIYIIIAGTLTYSICNYTFPKISRLSASGAGEEFNATVRGGLLSALFITVPFMAAAMVLAGEGTAIVYMRGAFTAEDTLHTARALRFILPAMPFFCVTELFSRMFYSLGKPRIPMLAAIGGILANFAVGAVLTNAGLLDIGAVGASNAAGQIVCAAILLIFAARRLPGLLTRRLLFETAKIILGGVLIFASCALISRLVASDPSSAGFFTNVWKAVVIFVPSAAVYLVYAKLVHIRFKG
ncbi:MAG: murein biosynthesis integral membrane protein MurJ [Ruminococcaceae bacterium]|nr:murein biosynthesis integral membrane protein MurJ [Oscillospiraceae bacterium]